MTPKRKRQRETENRENYSSLQYWTSLCVCEYYSWVYSLCVTSLTGKIVLKSSGLIRNPDSNWFFASCKLEHQYGEYRKNEIFPEITHRFFHVLCFVARLGLTLCDRMDCSLPGCSVHEDSPSKNTREGCHALLQGIFSTQGLKWNPGLPQCRQTLYCLMFSIREIKKKKRKKEGAKLFSWNLKGNCSLYFSYTKKLS